MQSFLYFPADAAQMLAIVQHVFFEDGLVIFSTRSKVPRILKEDRKSRFFEGDYNSSPGKTRLSRRAKPDMWFLLERCLDRGDAVLRCRQQGLYVGLINRPSINVVDEQLCVFFSFPFSINYMNSCWVVDDWRESFCVGR